MAKRLSLESMKEGLPKGAKPLRGFGGYYYFDNKKKGEREIYEPLIKEKDVFALRSKIPIPTEGSKDYVCLKS